MAPHQRPTLQAALAHIENAEKAKRQAAKIRRKNAWIILASLVLLVLIGMYSGSYDKYTDDSSTSKLSDIEQAVAFMRIVEHTGLISDAEARKGILMITLENPWHYEPKQIRLQAAQALQRHWASIHDPKRPDRAHIVLLDKMGNTVGGSKMYGTSISVKD